MQPIHQLLARIRFDADFGRAHFEIGYFDREDRVVHRVALHEVGFPAGERRMLTLPDEGGGVRRIPLHRVREVYRDGRLIWRRPG